MYQSSQFGTAELAPAPHLQLKKEKPKKDRGSLSRREITKIQVFLVPVATAFSMTKPCLWNMHQPQGQCGTKSPLEETELRQQSLERFVTYSKSSGQLLCTYHTFWLSDGLPKEKVLTPSKGEKIKSFLKTDDAQRELKYV